MPERAVTASRKPGGGKRRAQMELTGWFPSRAIPSPTNRFFTKHETRPFRMLPWNHSRADHRVLGVHETRNTNHDTRLFTRAVQASANSEVFTKHETRITNHGFYGFGSRNTRHETRDTAFCRATPSRGQQVFTKHETRITAFYRFTAFTTIHCL